MKFFIDIIKGVFIGAGAILPGISSGVLVNVNNIKETICPDLSHLQISMI